MSTEYAGLISRMHSLLGFDPNKTTDEKAEDLDKFMTQWSTAIYRGDEQTRIDTPKQEVYDEKYDRPGKEETDEPF